jgi:pilus assembly protein CpaE
MRYFLASDDANIAGQISAILIEHGQESPKSQIFGLDTIVPALEAAQINRNAKADDDSQELDPSLQSEVVALVVVSPNPERAFATMREIRRRTSSRILAIGPATDAKLVVRAIREGVSEYLDLAEIRTELSQALERLQGSEKSGTIIAVMAPSGGSGSSTIAVNLATALAQKHKQCALIDLKLEAGDLASLLNLKPSHTIADLCRNAERLDYSLLQGSMESCESGLRLLAAPVRIEEDNDVTAEALDLVLEMASRHFSFIVIDVDHTYQPVQKRALLSADLIVLVMTLDFISLRNTRMSIEFLKNIGVLIENIRVVANRCGQSGQLSGSQAEVSLNLKLLLSIPEDPKTINRANNNGIPAVLQSPYSKVSQCFVELATKLSAPAKSR